MPDTRRFKAKSVSCFSENSIDIIGLSDDDQKPDHFVVVIHLSGDGRSPLHCIELQTEAMVHPLAGAIQAVRLSAQQLIIMLTDSAHAELGYRALDITLPKQHERQLLLQYLHVCFDDVALTIEGS